MLMAKGRRSIFQHVTAQHDRDKRQDTLTVIDSTAIKTIHKSRSFQAYFVTSPINIGVYMAIRSCTKRIFPEAFGCAIAMLYELIDR